MGGISESDISIPVTLWHHGNSLRVAEGPGNAGMGFNVSIGGAVSRVVRGYPDDYNVANDNRKGWLYNGNGQNIQTFTSTSDDNLSICTDEATDRAFLQTLLYDKDTEPDVFYISAPGLSGQFVLGPDGTPRLVGQQDLAISYTSDSGGILSFTIKTNRGIIYTFTLASVATRKAEKYKSWIEPNYFMREYYSYSKELTYRPSWLLSQIESGTTGVKATFFYQMSDETISVDYRTRILSNSTTQADSLYYISDRRQDSNLTSVKLMTATNVSTKQIDITWSDDLISKIVTSETVSGSKQEFALEYFTAESALDYTFPKLERPFLSEIKQINSCVPIPSFTFSYYFVLSGSNQVPGKTNYMQDHFGFFNGVSANKNIPKIYYYQNETGARRFRVTPIPGMAATQILDGSNRNVDVNNVLFGAVESINYPTGGKTYYTYEANRYFDSSTNEELLGPGVRVKTIVSSGGEVLYAKGSAPITVGKQIYSRSYDYLQSGSSITSGKLLYTPVFSFATGSQLFGYEIIRTINTLAEEDGMMYSRVQEKIEGRGSNVYEFAVPGTYPQTTDGSWTATKNKIARNTCSASNYNNGYYTFPYAPNTEFSFARGFLSKQSVYSETGGTLVSETVYTYSPQGTATTIKGLRYEPLGDDIAFGNYSIITGQAYLLTSEVTKQYSEETPAEFSQTTTAYQYNSKNMTTLITKTNDDNSVVKQKVKYAYDYSITNPASSDLSADAIKKLNAQNRHGEVIETIGSYTPIAGTETVISADLLLFKDLNGKVLPYQTKKFPQGATFTESVVSAGTPQTFDYDQDYLTGATFEEYDDYGRLVNQIDNNKNRTSTHYAFNQGISVATFFNAKAQESIFEDFEFTTGRGMTTTGGSLVTGWTGERAFQLPSSGKITSYAANVSGTSYRVSCWTKASQATNLIFTAKNGATTLGTLTLYYTAGYVNNWNQLEGILTLSSQPSTFTVEVTSNNTITIDEIVVVNKNASVSSQTVKPLIGTTSQTDDRGRSVKFSYDPYGRKQYTWDAKRNLVGVNEYLTQKQPFPVINTGFTYSTSVIKSGQSITFGANAICVPVTYQWKVDGILQASTSSTLVKSFIYGLHNIEMVTTHPTYGSKSFVTSVCVDVPDAAFNVSVSPTNTVHYCSVNGDRVKVFTMNQTAGCAASQTAYSWYVTDINGYWVYLANTASITYDSPSYSYSMRCDVIVQCGLVDKTCGYVPSVTGSSYTNITFINNQPCP